jgi:hypothetical protein
MYQSPGALYLNAAHHQSEALREANHHRLVREAQEAAESSHQPATGHAFQRRIVALAMALVATAGVAILLI